MLRGLIASAAIVLTPCSAGAWEFRVRFVERVGTIDTPLESHTIDAASLEPRRIRMQFGVFDDDFGPAPAGGYIGWNVGAIQVSGAPGNSQERRTPGCLPPFNFASGAFANGNPPPANGVYVPDAPDFDFNRLTDIDNTLGTQSPLWLCSPDGTPAPMPAPTLRGYNSYQSTHEITINPHPGAVNYTITYSGNLIAALEWRHVGNPIAPDCGDPANPNDDVPGSLTYAPFPTQPMYFEAVLSVVVPAHSSVLLAGGALAFAIRRRRG